MPLNGFRTDSMNFVSTIILWDEQSLLPMLEALRPRLLHSHGMTTYAIHPRISHKSNEKIFDQTLWNHPMLDLYRPDESIFPERKPLLYLLPSLNEEDFDPEFAPQPTSATELPELGTWTMKFGMSVLEIWAARRQPVQLSHWCNRFVYADLVKNVGSQTEIGHIRKLHQCQPLDGICESVMTIRFQGRIRSLAMRFEGLDHRWLCTSLTLL